jgi:hypothetical protein
MGLRVDQEANAVAEAIARRLQVRARARADGAADRPGPEATALSSVELEVITATGEVSRPLEVRAEALSRRVSAQLSSLRPALDTQSLGLAAATIAVRQAAGRLGQHLSEADARAQRTASDLAAFRQVHRREAQAHYPASTLLAGGLLICAVLFEALFSATLFAQEDARGLLGGATTAVGLSGANVALGFLGGFLGLRYLQHVTPWLRAAGAAFFALALLAGLGLNGFAAMWRQSLADSAQATATIDARAQLTKDLERCLQRAGVERDDQSSESNARTRYRRNECQVQRAERLRLAGDGATRLQDRFSPQAVVLLMLGLGVWVFSALKGYSGFDDPYPDYGKLDRLARDARDERDRLRDDVREALEDPLDQAKAGAQSAMDIQAGRVSEMRKAYDAAAAEAIELCAQLARVDEATRQLIQLYREENRGARRTVAPAYFATSVPSPARIDPLALAGDLLMKAEADLAKARVETRASLDALASEVETRYAALLVPGGGHREPV